MPASPSSSPSSSVPFDLATSSARSLRYPRGWSVVTASDGSFSMAAPGPFTLEPRGEDFWELTTGGVFGPSFTIYVYERGLPDPSNLSLYSKGRLLSWAGSFGDPGVARRLRLGSGVGWRAPVREFHGHVGEAQVVIAHGVEISMSYLRDPHSGASALHAGRAFLDSLRMPAQIDVGGPS